MQKPTNAPRVGSRWATIAVAALFASLQKKRHDGTAGSKDILSNSVHSCILLLAGLVSGAGSPILTPR